MCKPNMNHSLFNSLKNFRIYCILLIILPFVNILQVENFCSISFASNEFKYRFSRISITCWRFILLSNEFTSFIIYLRFSRKSKANEQTATHRLMNKYLNICFWISLSCSNGLIGFEINSYFYWHLFRWIYHFSTTGSALTLFLVSNELEKRRCIEIKVKRD